MRSFCIFGILIFLSPLFLLAETADMKPTAKWAPIAIQCSDGKTADVQSNATFIQKVKNGNTFTVSVQEGQIVATEMAYSNGGHDTYQLRCYRCGLGQKIGVVNKEFCMSEYKMWDAEKNVVKQKCK